MSDSPFAEDNSLADKARRVATWLEETWLPGFSATRTDDSEATGELWLAWQAVQAVKRFEQPDYLLNPAAEDIFLLLVQMREMETQALAEPEAHRAHSTLAELVTAVLRHEFILELANRELAVLVRFEPQPPHWTYKAGEIVKPGDPRIAQRENWRLSASKRHALELIKSALHFPTVDEAYSTAVERFQRYYTPADNKPE